MTIMESKRPGTCNNCRGEIKTGELINWDRKSGATHYDPKGEICQEKVATEAERAEYQKVLLAELKAWDGKGSFQPKSFGDWVFSKVPA